MKRIGNRKNFTWGRITLAVLCLGAVFFTLQIIGKPFLLPLPWQVEADGPSAAYFGADGSVIVDKLGTRLLFLDENEKLTHVEQLNSASQLDYVAGVSPVAGGFYVWGSKMVADSGYVNHDLVLHYDLSGHVLDTVYQADRTGQNTERCLILDMDTDGETIWVTEAMHNLHDYQKCGLWVRKLTDGEPEIVLYRDALWVYEADYLPATNTTYSTDFFGQLFCIRDEELIRLPFGQNVGARNLLVLDEDTLIWSDSVTRDIYCNDKLLCKGTLIYSSLSVDKNGFAYDDENNSCLHRVSLSGEELQTVNAIPFSAGFGILTLLRFISPVFLLILVLVFAGKRLLRMKKDGGGEKKPAMLLTLFLIAALISVFYTVQFANRHDETLRREISILSRYFSDTVDQEVLQNAVFYKSDLDQDGGEAFTRWERAWNHLNDYYGDFRDRGDATDKAAYINLYCKVGAQYLCVYDSWAVTALNTRLVFGPETMEQKLGRILVFQRTSESIIYQPTGITNEEGNITGVLLLGMDYQLTNSQLVRQCLGMTLTLTVLFVTVFLLLTEGKKLLECLRRKKKLQAQGALNPELALVRPLFFLFNLTSSFDGVILVLVAKDMLAAAGVSEAARLTLMAAPTLAAGIGSIVGLPICNLLSGRIPVRKLTVFSCLLCMGSFIGLSLSVSWNAFALFCGLKLVSSLLNSILYGIFQAIPMRAENEEARYAAISESEMGKIGSTILGPLLGGVVAQVFSNQAIYLLNAASFLPVIGLLMAAMPKNTLYSARKRSLGAGKGTLKYVFSIPTLAYFLLLVIPAMTIGGYKSYLFPIYLSAMDLPKMYITVFYVVALTVARLMIAPISNAFRDVDHWKKTVLALLMIGTAFLGFAINSTYYWAILILVVNTVLERILKVSMSMLWPRQAKAHKLDLVQVSNLMSIFDQGAYAMKETVLSMFLLLGNGLACVAVGGFCLLCAGLYAVLTGRSAMARAENSPSK